MSSREQQLSPDNLSPRESSTGSPSPKARSDDGRSELEAPGPEDPDHIKNKLHFIINNVSKANIRRKRKNLKAILKPEHYEYFANYMVAHRVSKEPNCHEVYAQLLEVSGFTTFRKQLLESTYDYIKSLLSSDHSSFTSARQILRNLGIWLGLLTVARNKPVLAKKLALKELILEAFHARRLPLVLPFATKVLEQCAHSKIFRPPNPWLMALLSLLREIFDLPGLSTPLQLTIEVLFDNISLKIADIKPTELLKKGAKYGLRNRTPYFRNDVRSENKPIIDPSLALNVPKLKVHVSSAIERAIDETSKTLYQKAVIPACRTTQELVLKDFAHETDDAAVMRAAQNMARSLSSSLVLVHRESLRQSIQSQLSVLLEGVAQSESVCSQIASDNFDWTCALLEKGLLDKATAEISSTLSPLLSSRKHESSSYVNSLPEGLRASPGGLTPQQLSVYEEFARCQVAQKEEEQGSNWAHQESLEKLLKSLGSLEDVVSRIPDQSTMSFTMFQQNPKQNRELLNYSRSISAQLDRIQPDTAREALSAAFGKQLLMRVCDTESQPSVLLIDLYIHILKSVKAGCPGVAKHLNDWWLEADEAAKISTCTANLLKARLLPVTTVDLHLAKLVKGSIDTQKLEAITSLLHYAVSEESSLRVFDFPQFFEAINKYPKKHNVDGLVLLLETYNKGPTKGEASARTIQDAANPESEVILYLFERWVEVRELANDKAYSDFLEVLQQHRVLSTPEKTVDFFLLLTNLCVSGQNEADSQGVIDGLATLIVFLVKFFIPAWDEPSASDPNASKLQLLKAFLYAACRLVRVEFEACSKSTDRAFNPSPYLVLFTKLLQYLNTPDPNLDSNNIDVLLAFGHCFRLLRPARVPSFAFAWLELISHRMYMPKLLIAKAPTCLSMFERLLVDLFEFLQPYLRNVELTDSIRVLYKGTLRVLLVLVRDFPEFLGEYHFSFCNVIPTTAVQIRNIVLAAFPRDMELPNPFTPNLKVDLSQITQPPYVASDVTAQLVTNKLLTPLTSFLSKRSPNTFLNTIIPHLQLKDPKEIKRAGTQYNVQLLNSLVLYVGLQGIIKLQNTTSVAPMLVDNSCMDIFDHLVQNLDMEGRYYFLNAIANQLRYPNNHTHYFSCLLLVLFATQSIIREQITRVLFERVVCHPPHPWGLLITFIELIRNTRYAFWEQPFIKCHPEIERLFESVARICVPVKPSGSGQTGDSAPSPVASSSPSPVSSVASRGTAGHRLPDKRHA